MEQKEIKATGVGNWLCPLRAAQLPQIYCEIPLESLDQGRIRNEQIIKYFKEQNISTVVQSYFLSVLNQQRLEV